MKNIEDITGLTYNEVSEYLVTGKLPDNFRERLQTASDLFDEGVISCENCDGVRDMNAVFRNWEAGFLPCPNCCEQ